jgi:YHYH protein
MKRSRSPVLRAVAFGGVVLIGIGAWAGFAVTSLDAGAATRVDPTALPLGDGHVSTSPKIGNVDTCQTQFGNVGGAQAVGPWVNAAAKTWNSTTKIAVQGAVSWPTASFSTTVSGGRRVVQTNDLPQGHTTGTFPVSGSDPASAYDRNPNHIAAQSITWNLPADPTAAGSPSCTNGGPIGVLTDGVLLFNALDGEGRDAAAHEVLDSCGGHPEMSATYHHHEVPSCILDKATGRATLVGYATDGYGIYAERDAHGALLTNGSLDACHGRTSTVTWNGKKKKLYHYDATLEYPYTVGCFHGTPTNSR